MSTKSVTPVTFELPDAILARFDQLYLDNDTAKNAIFKELVVRHLEDIEDGIAADLVLQAIKEGEPTISLKEVMKKHGLDDLEH